MTLALSPPDGSLLYVGRYDPVLVSLSIATAILASYASLLVAQHVSRAATAVAKRVWIATGGLCMGADIWAMHFVGMLALDLRSCVTCGMNVVLSEVLPSCAEMACRSTTRLRYYPTTWFHATLNTRSPRWLSTPGRTTLIDSRLVPAFMLTIELSGGFRSGPALIFHGLTDFSSQFEGIGL